jgi:HD-GYP domain-containing protein (c-di-GMP phosphodiesterase class II)
MATLSLLDLDHRPSGVVPDKTAPEEFCPVDLDGLVDDTELDFDLYLQAGTARFVFYRNSRLPFTSRHRGRLLDNGVRTLYIRTAERHQYLQYLENNLDRVLGNPVVAPPKKAQLLYSVSQVVMQETFDQPRSKAIGPRTRKIAERTVDFVLRSNRAVGQLARLMSTDYYTYTHSINVCVFGVTLARHIGLADRELKEYAVGALLHDLGKAEIAKDLLTRTGPLTAEEMEDMRKHVVIGEQILRDHHDLSATAMIPVSQHHEKMDGTGYPRAISGGDFHVFGRITAIADTFDAMTSKRSYQRAYTPFETLKLMREDLRAKFDQTLLEQFIRLLKVPT